MAMEGNVTFSSLEDGINELKKLADGLSEPIEKYENETKDIGEQGSVWGGTAAGNAAPVLDRIKKNIVHLQSMVNKFSADAGFALNEYAEAQQIANQQINELSNIDKPY